MKVISIGKMGNHSLASLENEYVKWIRRFTKIEIIELKQQENHDDINKIIREQEELILKNIHDTDFVCLLNIQGKMLDSLAFSKLLNKWHDSGKEVVFVIGGSYGVGEMVIARANYNWSFSQLTFPHLLARIILLEQIFRSYKIINNQAYHK